MQFNTYISLLFLSFATTFILSIYSFNKRNKVKGGKEFFILISLVSLWCMAGSFEQMATQLETKIFWSVICYISIPNVPLHLFLFVVKYTQDENFGRPVFVKSLYSFSVITLIIAATNSYHGLLWPEIEILSGIGGITARYGHGFWFWVNTAFCYLLVFGALLLLIRGFLVYRDLFIRQTRILIFSLSIPLLVSVTYIFFGEYIQYIDITPLGFTFSSVFLSYGIFRYNFLDLVPAARNILFDNLKEGILLLDKEKRIVDSNRLLWEIFNSEQNTGRQFGEVFKPYPAFTELVENEGRNTREFTVDERFLETSVIKITDKSGDFQGLLITIIDITELKLKEIRLTESRQELTELNDAKDKLFSIIAHDLKNPFFGIIGLSEILSEDFEELTDTEKKNLIDEIHMTAKSTLGILENLLAWSRQQTGTIAFNPVNFEINVIADEVIQSLRRQASIKNIEIKLVQSDVIFVYADQHMVETVIRNLISNAIKFSHPGSSIIVTIGRQINHSVIEIKDFGVGINEETMARLFRVHQDNRSYGTLGEKGTGLGLIICRDFIHKNSGKLTFESTPGEGTIFRFTLPVYEKF